MRLFYLFLFLPVIILSQQKSDKDYISGYISEELKDGSIVAIEGANIVLEGANIGSVSNKDGFYKIESPDRYPVVLIVSFVGYDTYKKKINNWRKSVDIVLNSSVKIDQVNIRKNSETSTSSLIDPINNLTLTSDELEKAACCNLSECFETTSSVDVNLSDGIAGVKKIKMLSLDGVNILITQDNMPFVRGASSGIGISYIPGSWIESIQISKGSSSILNGTESLTGQINVALYTPENAPKLMWNGYVNNEGKIENNLILSKTNGSWRSNFFTHVSFLNREVDHHGSLHDHSDHSDIHGSDGFLDVPKLKHINILNRWKYYGSDKYVFQLNGQLIYEDRIAGTTTDADVYYNVNIHNDLQEIRGKFGLLQPNQTGKSIGSQFSFRRHNSSVDINSVFSSKYSLLQESAYFNLIRQTYLINKENILKYGISSFIESYDSSYDLIFGLNTDLTEDRFDFISGFYTEFSSDINKVFSIVSGLRAEYYNVTNKTYILPRSHLRVNPDDNSSLRFSFGRSFRVPNIISENIHLLFSNRILNYTPVNLDKPEIAWNFGANFSYCFYLFNREGTFNIDLYRTIFEDQIVIDIESPGEISFSTLNGDSYANVLETFISYELWYNLDVKMGYKINKTSQPYNGFQNSIPLNPKDRLMLNFGYHNDLKTWIFDATCNYIGKSRIPSYLDNHYELQGGMSDKFYVFNTHITRSWDNFDCYIGIENITDVTQDSPILHAHNPSSSNFDAGLIYGPVMGRMFYLGFRYKIN